MTDLRRLAEAATAYAESEGLDWWEEEGLGRMTHGDMAGVDAAYIAAASPDVILALLDENARLRAALTRIADDRVGVDDWSRKQARAALEAK